MKQERRFGVTGACSILMIFVVLCITVFALLSLLSARADLRLSEKTRQSAEQYYTADAETEKTLGEIDAILVEATNEGLAQEKISALDAVAKADGGRVLISIKIDEQRTLQTELTLWPTGDEGARYTIASRRIISDTPWEEEYFDFAIQ